MRIHARNSDPKLKALQPRWWWLREKFCHMWKCMLVSVAQVTIRNSLWYDKVCFCNELWQMVTWRSWWRQFFLGARHLRVFALPALCLQYSRGFMPSLRSDLQLKSPFESITSSTWIRHGHGDRYLPEMVVRGRKFQDGGWLPGSEWESRFVDFVKRNRDVIVSRIRSWLLIIASHVYDLTDAPWLKRKSHVPETPPVSQARESNKGRWATWTPYFMTHVKFLNSYRTSCV